MVASKQSTVTERRALLTDREREIISGDADVEDSYRYQTISRVRARFNRLGGDLDALEKHGDLADELREIICRAESGGQSSVAPSTDTADTRPAVDRAQLREALAGSGDILEARVDAIVAMYDRLRRKGEATKAEMLDVVDADTVNYAGPDSVWANMVKGKKTLRTLPGVEPPPTGRSTWRHDPEGGGR